MTLGLPDFPWLTLSSHLKLPSSEISEIVKNGYDRKYYRAFISLVELTLHPANSLYIAGEKKSD